MKLYSMKLYWKELKMTEWISVEDKLPEHGFSGYVTNGRQVLLGAIYDAQNNKWWAYTSDLKITHWMPVPKPPLPKHEKEVRKTYDELVKELGKAVLDSLEYFYRKDKK